MSHSANVTATLVHQGQCWRIGAIGTDTIKEQAGEERPLPFSGLLIVVTDKNVNARRVEIGQQVLNYGWEYREVEQ